jgi:hypothetical protein
LRAKYSHPFRGISHERFAQGELPSGNDLALVALEVVQNSIHHDGVSKIEQMEAELRKLSQTELRRIRDWLDDVIEDKLEFTPEFENSYRL